VAEKEFYSFEEALRELSLREEELKRLVSEGEIRAFRDAGTMKLRRADVDTLRKELSGGDVVDLGEGGETVVFEDDAMTTQEIGMATEEIVADVAEVEEVAAPASPRSATARTAAAATMVDEDEAPAARAERPRPVELPEEYEGHARPRACGQLGHVADPAARHGRHLRQVERRGQRTGRPVQVTLSAT
jgi:hypothetical protein